MSSLPEYSQLKEQLSILENEIHRLKNNELELKQLNEDKVKLISIISHDLKNPMNTIIGLADLLEKKIQKNDLEVIEEYAKNINRSTQKIRALLSNLLDWSITLSGKIEFRPIETSLREIITEVLDLLEETLKIKSIHIDYECQEDVIVLVDKEMISTVIRNIISNSIKFSHAGGVIKIVCAKVGESILIHITDFGIGMSAETINSLFKVGQLKSNQGTKSEDGTGIGLLMCKDFLLKHNSKIIVESEMGKGSTFSFNLPLSLEVSAYTMKAI